MTIGAAEFDQVYNEIARSTRYDRLHQEWLGLPAGLESTGLLTGGGLTEIAELLALGPEQALLDLGCGRGGYGLELARRTGTRLVGVDFSPVAVQRAGQSAAALGLAGRAEYVVGTLTDTGLAGGAVDAAVCLDAIQFADPTRAAAQELRRVVRPGGRVVVTTWQARDRADQQLPDRFRRLDLHRSLTEAGFGDVDLMARPEWLEVERRFFIAALAVGSGDDSALESLRDEAEQVLPLLDRLDRVCAIAVNPD